MPANIIHVLIDILDKKPKEYGSKFKFIKHKEKTGRIINNNILGIKIISINEEVVFKTISKLHDIRRQNGIKTRASKYFDINMNAMSQGSFISI